MYACAAAASDSGRSERPRKSGCRGSQRRDLLTEAAVRSNSVALGFRQLDIDSLQCVGNRLVKRGKRSLGEVEKRRPTVLERFCRRRLEHVAQSVFRLIEQLVRGAERGLLPIDFFLKPLVVLVRCGELCGQLGARFGNLSARMRLDEHHGEASSDKCDRDECNHLHRSFDITGVNALSRPQGPGPRAQGCLRHQRLGGISAVSGFNVERIRS